MSLSAGQQAILRALGEGAAYLEERWGTDIYLYPASSSLGRKVSKRVHNALETQRLIAAVEKGNRQIKWDLTDRGREALRALEQEAEG